MQPDRRRLSITISVLYYDTISKLIFSGLYMDHQGAVRRSLQDLFEKHGVEAFTDKREPKIIERQEVKKP